MLNKLIALGLVLGLLVGLGASMTGNEVLQTIARESAPLGKLFINAIKMVVLPLVITVIFASIAKLGDPATLGKIGGKTLAFYWVTLIPAIIIGMTVMTIGLKFTPDITVPDADPAQVPQLQSITDFLVGLVPPNPFEAAAKGALLPLIVFTAILAAATGTLAIDKRTRLITAAEDLSEALIKMVWWILYLAPIGIFGLIAPATAKMGWGLLQSLGVFIVCVFIGLLILLFVLFLPLNMFVGKIKPLDFLKGIWGAISVAFSTTSTAAAIPVSLRETTENLKVSETVADILVPLGASLYRPGSALFQGAAIIFLAHIFNVPVSMAEAGAIILATFLVSLTVAPVPSSSIVTMAPALSSIGVPATGLGILFGIDRIPDMMRTCVNVIGQISTAVLVDRTQSKSQKELKRDDQSN